MNSALQLIYTNLAVLNLLSIKELKAIKLDTTLLSIFFIVISIAFIEYMIMGILPWVQSIFPNINNPAAIKIKKEHTIISVLEFLK